MTSQTVPILVGHRGWPACWPENTLEGFAAAAETGARWLECDVQLSADLIPFVCHDVSLRRTAGLEREITVMPATDLDLVSVGEPARFGTRHANVKLPRLSALIEWLMTQHTLKLFVEIKRQSLRYHGIEPVVAKVMQALMPALQQCTVISFDHRCLGLARQQGARTTGWAVEDASEPSRRVAAALRPDYLFTDEKLFTRMRAAFPGAWQWIVYHTENPVRVLELAGEVATMVETNDIGGLLRDPRLSTA